MQTLYNHYEKNHLPLCTMSEWGWHTTPTDKGCYKPDDVIQTEYSYAGRKVYYPVKETLGNEHIYHWLRHNPHKFNLCRIFICINGHEIEPSDISHIHQILHLYEGKIESNFSIKGQEVKVISTCDSQNDALGFLVKSKAKISIKIAFPYGSHVMSGADWKKENHHSSTFIRKKDVYIISRSMDDIQYNTGIAIETGEVIPCGKHSFEIIPQAYEQFAFTVSFSQGTVSKLYFSDCLSNSRTFWKDFWSNCGIVDFTNAKDKRAWELERRIVLSLYLSRVQGCGCLPPAETGLTLNSWYGRFHLEMHLWHSAYLPLYNNAHLLEKSLKWYKKILNKACKNADKNGYKGARWPKQVSPEGVDSPSPIAPLLVWQQPHIIYMLELTYRQQSHQFFLQEYWDVVKKSVDFICDFLHYNKMTKQYELIAPLIPAQEEHDPENVKNPTFELEYFRFGIGIGIEWAKRIKNKQPEWNHVYNNIAMPTEKDGLYLAHENCLNTFKDFNTDHPSMLGALGLIPKDRIDNKIMEATLNKVLKCWKKESMWGWDFAMMAMTATRLGLPNLAIDLLMMDTPKNTYVKSGNNFQCTRRDLPLYLPGNGSLLLAIAMMVGGYEGSEKYGPMPGLPNNGLWDVKFENIGVFM